jgi:hypothetical protein
MGPTFTAYDATYLCLMNTVFLSELFIYIIAGLIFLTNIKNLFVNELCAGMFFPLRPRMTEWSMRSAFLIPITHIVRDCSGKEVFWI